MSSGSDARISSASTTIVRNLTISKPPPTDADALLPEEGRAGRAQPHADDHEQEHRQGEQEADGGEGDVDRPLDAETELEAQQSALL